MKTRYQKNHHLGIRIDEEMWHQLQQLARQKGLAVSYLARIALGTYLENNWNKP